MEITDGKVGQARGSWEAPGLEGQARAGGALLPLASAPWPTLKKGWVHLHGAATTVPASGWMPYPKKNHAWGIWPQDLLKGTTSAEGHISSQCLAHSRCSGNLCRME